MNNPVAKHANKFNKASAHKDKKNDYQRTKFNVRDWIEEDDQSQESVKDNRLLCLKCFTLWGHGTGQMIRHPKLKEKVEVCPNCKCWWRIRPADKES